MIGHTITGHCEEVLRLISKVSEAMERKQVGIDTITKELQEVVKIENQIRAKIKPLRDDLLPLAHIRAGLSSTKSRNKYFPGLNESQMIEHAKGIL